MPLLQFLLQLHVQIDLNPIQESKPKLDCTSQIPSPDAFCATTGEEGTLKILAYFNMGRECRKFKEKKKSID